MPSPAPTSMHRPVRIEADRAEELPGGLRAAQVVLGQLAATPVCFGAPHSPILGPRPASGTAPLRGHPTRGAAHGL